MQRIQQFHVIALGMAVLSASMTQAAERSLTLSKTDTDSGLTRNSDVLLQQSTLDLKRAIDLPRIVNPYAELEATDVYFTYDFHFGTDTAHSHRVEAVITNIDTTRSGFSRTWEIYSFPAGGYPYGITLVDQGTIPSLAAGESYEFWSSLPSSVLDNRTYVLILSAGDANRNNDIAVDQP